jgi:zinc protease
MLTATRELSLQALEDRLRPLDARMELSASEVGAQLAMQVPRAKLEEALAIAVQALREPEFPADVYEERKRRLIANIRSRQDQPDSIVSDALRRAGFPYPPEDPRHYRPPEERIADLEAHTLERMKAFYRDFAGASHAQFAAVGNVEPQALVDWLRNALGDWKSPQRRERIVRPFHPLPNDRRLRSVSDKPNAVYLQARAVPVGEDDPDYIPLALALRMFGSDADSRVSRRLREEESLTYGAYALLSSDREVSSGLVTIRAIHAPGNVGRVEQAIDEEIRRALRDGFTEAELESARRSWADRRLQVLSDEGSVASILASNLYWNDTMQRWLDRDERIRTLTLDEVNAVFRKYVKPDEALILGAGDYD